MDPAPTDPPPPGASVAAPAPARPRGRRRWIVLGALGLGLVALWVCSGGGAKTKVVTMTFIGFSNYSNVALSNDAKMHAWFWLTNGSRPVIWQITSVGRKMEEAWVDQGPVRWWIHQRLPDLPNRELFEPPHQVQLISFTADEAKLPFRVVMTLKERATGVARAWESLRQWHTDHVRKGPELILIGRNYSLTNEFHPKP